MVISLQFERSQNHYMTLSWAKKFRRMCQQWTPTVWTPLAQQADAEEHDEQQPSEAAEQPSAAVSSRCDCWQLRMPNQTSATRHLIKSEEHWTS